jgi:hypothetical protein
VGAWNPTVTFRTHCKLKRVKSESVCIVANFCTEQRNGLISCTVINAQLLLAPPHRLKENKHRKVFTELSFPSRKQPWKWRPWRVVAVCCVLHLETDMELLGCRGFAHAKSWCYNFICCPVTAVMWSDRPPDVIFSSSLQGNLWDEGNTTRKKGFSLSKGSPARL